MIWALLALLGVPLWLCALCVLALVYRNRGLRQRHGAKDFCIETGIRLAAVTGAESS